jgi:hypothetical protein
LEAKEEVLNAELNKRRLTQDVEPNIRKAHEKIQETTQEFRNCANLAIAQL